MIVNNKSELWYNKVCYKCAYGKNGFIKSKKEGDGCTPIGTFPEVDQKPNIDYNQLGADHIAFDLIYNPEVTAFLNEAKKRGAKIKNGYEMLVSQAEASWEIWHR